MKEAVENIKKSKGIDLDINAIPIDDKETYELFSKGMTRAQFQFESAGMQKHLQALQPTQFEDLIAMNALYRPDLCNIFRSLSTANTGEKNRISFSVMEKRLKDTYGITVYQNR